MLSGEGEKIRREDIMLFAMCWFVYFFTYFGRMNYAACLAEMIIAESYSKALAGLIGTGFFITYGLGQIVSGFLGDYLPPRWMIFTGVAGSAVCNFLMGTLPDLHLMIGIWCVNGFFQSLIWSPIVRMFAQYFTLHTRGTLGVYINSTVPVGTLATYGFTALILSVTGSWRMVFCASSIVLAVTAVGWFFATAWLLPRLQMAEDGEAASVASKSQDVLEERESFGKMLLSSGMIFMCLVLLMQGMLKEGITTWIPTFLYEQFNLGTSLAIISTALIPMLNICGITIAAVARKKVGDEVKSSFYLFIVGTVSLIMLYGASFVGLVPTFVLFAVATTIMMAVNTVYVGVIPGYFGKVGRSSSVSGMLNAFVNLGIALSTFGFGALSASFGWNFTMVSWCVCGALGIVFSFSAYRLWKIYKVKLRRG